MSPNDAYGMANNVDPDQTAPLIWVYTVCPGLSVRKLSSLRQFWFNDQFSSSLGENLNVSAISLHFCAGAKAVRKVL